MSSRYIKDFSKEDVEKYYPNTGGHVAAKGVDAYARDPERFLSVKADDEVSKGGLLEIAEMMNGDTKYPEDYFMSSGNVPLYGGDANKILKEVDAHYGTAFEQKLNQLSEKWKALEKECDEFAADLLSFMNE